MVPSDRFGPNSRRHLVHTIIFEAETPAGKRFDLWLMVAIVISVAVVMLESVAAYGNQYGRLLHVAEWFFTILFTIEYALRLYSVRKPLKYAVSFFGIVDLLSILPTYLSLLLPGAQFFLIIRLLRVLRIFRVLKLVKYLSEGQTLSRALRASRPKITVFLFTVLTSVVILGSMMYLIESEEAGFTSIPRSVYWAVVTLTTVGYGDIAPQTALGQALAAVVMIMGYAIIAVPTGIVTVELSNLSRKGVSTEACPSCSAEGHDVDARYCKFCGERL